MKNLQRKNADPKRRPLAELLDAITHSYFCAECGAESDRPLGPFHPLLCKDIN